MRLLPLVLLLITVHIHAADPQAGWPMTFPNSLTIPPVVADLVGGPEKEVLIRLGAYELTLLHHDGSSVDGWPVDIPQGWGSVGTLLIGDVLPSHSGLEIVAVLSPGAFVTLGAEGTILGGPFPYPYGSFGNSYAQLADLDGDGDLEIVQPGVGQLFGQSFVDELLARHGDGSIVDGYPILLPEVNWPGWSWPQSMSLADVDFDGVAEIAISPHGPDTQNWPFYMLRSDGTVMPGFPPPISLYYCQSVGNVSIADFDLDYDAELAGGGRLCLVGLRSDGSVHWSTENAPNFFYSNPAIGNFDADPHLEVAIGGHDGVRIFDPDTGEYIGTTDPAYREGFYPLAGDVNGDGIDELVVVFTLLWTADQSSIHVIDVATMTNLPGWPLVFGLYAGVRPMAAIVDLDYDGDLEVICHSEFTVYIYDLPNPGPSVTHVSWPTYLGNNAENRDYHFGRMPQPKFIRGDANRDGAVDLGDVVREAEALFYGVESACPLAFDVNDDGKRNIADLVALVGYQYMGAQTPSAPFPECGAVANTPECLLFECP